MGMGRPRLNGGFAIGLITGDDPDMELVDQSSSGDFAIVLSTGDRWSIGWPRTAEPLQEEVHLD